MEGFPEKLFRSHSTTLAGGTFSQPLGQVAPQQCPVEADQVVRSRGTRVTAPRAAVQRAGFEHSLRPGSGCKLPPPFPLRAGTGQGLAGTVLQQLRLPTPGYKGGGGGGGCSRHWTGAPRAAGPQGAGECRCGVGRGVEGKGGPLAWGICPLTTDCALSTFPRVSLTLGCWEVQAVAKVLAQFGEGVSR